MKKYLIKTEEGCKLTVKWSSRAQSYILSSVLNFCIFFDSIKFECSENFGEIKLFKLGEYCGSITFRKENLEILEDEEK